LLRDWTEISEIDNGASSLTVCHQGARRPRG
jgi:hypothetical protein